MLFSIIIPAHNEEASISQTIEAAQKTVQPGFEIVVVNDHSTDQTCQVVKNLALKYSNIKLVDNLKEPCFANALLTGFNNAQGEFVVPVMADLCDEMQTINEMAQKAKDGCDIIAGSRYIKGGKKIGGPMLKSLFSRTFGCALYYLIAIPTNDVANAFKMYRSNLVKSLNLETKWFEISAEITLKAFFRGAKVTEVPTTWRDRTSGESKFYITKVGKSYIKLFFWALGQALIKNFRKN